MKCVDFGDDDYTRGRPHPMIDPELRDADVLKALHDPTVALVHFDVVLGFGASGDPIGPLLSGLAEFQREARTGPVLSAHVLGTDLDSQGRPGIVERLRAVGVHVSDTNAEAAVLANSVADQLVVRGAA